MTCNQIYYTLSIDSKYHSKEAIIIFLSTVSKKREVVVFLEELHMFLNSDSFDIDADFVLIRKAKAGDEKHSTPFTLLDLDYSLEDVIERLKELTVEEYSETKIDKDDLDPPLLFVFGKEINRKLVYIKLKIKNDKRKHVLCVSFHYAKEKMLFPYA